MLRVEGLPRLCQHTVPLFLPAQVQVGYRASFLISPSPLELVSPANSEHVTDKLPPTLQYLYHPSSCCPSYYPIHIPFLLPCSLATYIFFSVPIIYQLIWLSPVILYEQAVKELTEQSENGRKWLVWALGTTEYRINLDMV